MNRNLAAMFGAADAPDAVKLSKKKERAAPKKKTAMSAIAAKTAGIEERVHHSTVEVTGRLARELQRIESDETSLDVHLSWLVWKRLSFGSTPDQFADARKTMSGANMRMIVCVAEHEPERLWEWCDDRGHVAIWLPLQGHSDTTAKEMTPLLHICKRISTWLIKCSDVSPETDPFSVHICDSMRGVVASVLVSAIMTSVYGTSYEQAAAFVTRAYVHRNRALFTGTDAVAARPKPRMLPSSTRLSELAERLAKATAAQSIYNFMEGTIGAAKNASGRERMAGFVAEMLVLAPDMEWRTPQSVPRGLTLAEIDQWLAQPVTKWDRQRQAERELAETEAPVPEELTDAGDNYPPFSGPEVAIVSSSAPPTQKRRVRCEDEYTEEVDELRAEENDMEDDDVNDPDVRRALWRIRRRLKEIRELRKM